MTKLKFILTIAMTYLTLVGMVMFPLFICQEAIQTTMFGTWPAQDSRQWHIVKNGVNLMQKFSLIGKIINYGFGWIQPFGFFSYKSYFQSADYYTESLKAKCLAKAPELFINEHVEFEFKPRSITPSENGKWTAKNGQITVLLKDKPNLKQFIKVSGILNEDMTVITK